MIMVESLVHKTTNQPRTNGLVERFNHVFVESLRKVVDEDVENWIEYLPFVLLAYRTKINTSTGFTPYRLMFGREVNQFTTGQLAPRSSAKTVSKTCLVQLAIATVELEESWQTSLSNLWKKTT